jgi:tRNA modification GTPase
MHDLDRTVVAVATPPGRGGVGCIRLSGPDAHRMSDALFRSAGDGDRYSRAEFGRFLDRHGQVVDHGYRVRFPESGSFTGEPVAELWAHGSPPVLSALVEAAAELGAMPAEPGEFAYRAMVHGRIDLARAEAIRDLVDATTRYQAKLAHAQAEGALSRTLKPIRDDLSELIVRTEAAVEFEDEAETHLACRTPASPRCSTGSWSGTGRSSPTRRERHGIPWRKPWTWTVSRYG